MDHDHKAHEGHPWFSGPDLTPEYQGRVHECYDRDPLPYGNMPSYDPAPAKRRTPGRDRILVGVGLVSVTLLAPVLWIVPVALALLETGRPDSDRSPWQVADGFFRVAGMVTIWVVIFVVSVLVGFLAVGTVMLT